jgi:hypothetical protein
MMIGIASLFVASLFLSNAGLRVCVVFSLDDDM